jgi:hypothetical protein
VFLNIAEDLHFKQTSGLGLEDSAWVSSRQKNEGFAKENDFQKYGRIEHYPS